MDEVMVELVPKTTREDIIGDQYSRWNRRNHEILQLAIREGASYAEPGDLLSVPSLTVKIWRKPKLCYGYHPRAKTDKVMNIAETNKTDSIRLDTVRKSQYFSKLILILSTTMLPLLLLSGETLEFIITTNLLRTARRGKIPWRDFNRYHWSSWSWKSSLLNNLLRKDKAIVTGYCWYYPRCHWRIRQYQRCSTS